MSEWFSWAARVAATVVLFVFAASFLLIAAVTPKALAVGLGGAAVTGLAGWFTWPRIPNAWRRDPPTQRQLEYAADLGIRVPRRATKGQVSDLISAAKAR
jgi:hypothetical protein